MKKFIFAILIVNLFFLSTSLANESSVYTTSEKVYSVGDLHGDLDSFRKALLAVRIIDKHDNWTADKAHLVLVGDLVDRGPETRKLMEYVMDLENKAKAMGGQVHTLLGNHEFMVTNGVIEYMHYNDATDFKDFRRTPYEKGVDGFLNAFKNDTVFAKWFRSRKLAVQINQTIFVHAGLDQWANHLTIAQINRMGKSWLEYFQGVGQKPNEKSRWIIENSGPIWTRVFVDYETGKNTLSFEDLKTILKKHKANKVVVGHSTIKSVQEAVSHPTYGGSVILTDTGLSKSYNLQISVFEHFEDGKTTAYKISRDFSRITDVFSVKSPIGLCKNIYKTI